MSILQSTRQTFTNSMPLIFGNRKPAWPDPEQSIGEECLLVGGLKCWLPIGPALAAFEDLSKDLKDLLEKHIDALKQGEPKPMVISIHMWMIGSKPELSSPTIVLVSKSSRQTAFAKALLKDSRLLDQYPGVRIKTLHSMPAIYEAVSQEPDTIETTRGSTDNVSHENNLNLLERPGNIVSPDVAAEMKTDSSAHFKNQLDITQPVAQIRGQDECQPASNPWGVKANGRGCVCIVCLGVGSVSTNTPGIYTCRVGSCHWRDTDCQGILKHEMDHFGGPGRYHCAENGCNFATHRWSELKRHYMRLHCRSRTLFPCPVIGCEDGGMNGFGRKDKLKSHLNNVHEIEFTEPSPKVGGSGPSATHKEHKEHSYDSDPPTSSRQLLGRQDRLSVDISNDASSSRYASNEEEIFPKRRKSAPMSESSSELEQWPDSAEPQFTDGPKCPRDENPEFDDIVDTEARSPPYDHLSDEIITCNSPTILDLPGSVRIEWQCHCGFASFDEFISLQPGAIADYQTSLRDLIAIRNVAPSLHRRRASGLGGRSFFGTISDLISPLIPKREGTIPYSNTQMAPINCSHAFQPSLPPVSAAPRPLYLLLCIPCQKFATQLLQLDIKDLHSDRSFFKLLQDNYRDMRGWWRRTFSLKTIQGIKFVQFELHQPDLVDIQRYDDVPPESRKDEYHYSPIPPKILPPVGGNLMLHYYTSPCSARETGVVLNRIPKKLKERLQVCPINGTSEGWGIYFLEGWHVGIIAILGFAILLVASLIFLICWSVLNHDVQGAVGIATYIMAFVTLGIGSLQAAFEL